MSFLNLYKKPTVELEVKSTVGFGGYFTLRRVNIKTGDVTQELKFKNTITTLALNKLGSTTNTLQYCYVGTGTAAPSTSNTKLGNRIATTGTITGNVYASDVSVDHYASRTVTFRFGAGAAAGNLTEIGIGWEAAGISDNYLWSRQLILDGSGNPTTLTVLATEYLDVTYELRLYPNLSPVAGSLSLTGGGTYSYLIRPSYITNWACLNTSVGVIEAGAGVATVCGSTNAAATASFPANYTAEQPLVSAGTLQTYELNAMGIDSYTSGTFKHTTTSGTLGTASGNFASGIIALKIGPYMNGSYQLTGLRTQHLLILDSRIPKTSSNTVNFKTDFSWSVHAL